MKKQLIMTKSLVILMLTMAAVVNAQSPSNHSEQPKTTFIPNVKPTDWKEVKRLPLPTPNKWKVSLKPLQVENQ